LRGQERRVRVWWQLRFNLPDGKDIYRRGDTRRSSVIVFGAAEPASRKSTAAPLEPRQTVVRAASFSTSTPMPVMADKNSTSRSGHSSNLSCVRRSPISKRTTDTGDVSGRRNFPEMAREDDNIGGDGIAVVQLLEKIP
ncbi:unnamed protein product, partial [Sphacelaria rigidula]